MDRLLVVCFCVLSTAVMCQTAVVRGESARSRELREMLLGRRALECKAKWASCSGMPKCCGTLQCYWENGYSVITDGQCVDCVDRDLVCQRDSQCCEFLQCDKSHPLHVDGVCQIRRALESTCYRDAQCESGNCKKKWYKVHGACKVQD